MSTGTETKELRFVRALTEALEEEMTQDERVLVIGEDIGVAGGTFGVTRGLYDKFGPRRVKDTPISESAFVGLALGAAMTGLRPVVEVMFMDFITVCMDPLINHAAKVRYMFGGQYSVPLTLITLVGGGLSAGPHHSQSLEAWFCHVPGLKVVMPSTPADAKGLLKASIRDNNPVIFLEHKNLLRLTGPVPVGEYSIPLGKADIKRQGTDVTVVATAALVHEALKAAKQLEGEGVSLEVVDPRTLSPLDMETILASVKKTGRLVVAHEAVRFCGLGAEIAAQVAEEAFDYLDAPVKRVGAPFAPVPMSPPLEKALLPSAEDIIRAVKEIAPQGKN